jgi:hypothetical protein
MHVLSLAFPPLPGHPKVVNKKTDLTHVWYVWSLVPLSLCLFHRTETLFHTIVPFFSLTAKGDSLLEVKVFSTHLLITSSLFPLPFSPSTPPTDVYEKAFGNVRSLFDEDLPLPKDWMAGVEEDAHSKTFGGSHPFHGNPGGNPGQPGRPIKPHKPNRPNPANPNPGANTRVLSTAQDLPLLKDWTVAAAKDSTYGGGENGGGHHEHGSYPYGGGPGGHDGGDHTDGEDPSYGNPGYGDNEDPSYGNPGYGDNAYPAYGGDHHDKMAAVPGAVAYTPKAPVVRSLETVMFKKSKDDQKTPFNLRGRQPST